jgi:hypothetical protein
MALRRVVVLDDNVTLTAGAGDHTSSVWTKTDTNTDAMLLIKLTNGATGPTVAAQSQVQVSADNSNYFNYGGPISPGTANNATVSQSVPLSANVNYAKVVSGSNTVQNVTVRVEAVG